MQCGLCPSRNRLRWSRYFWVTDFARCFRNISVVIATSCRFLCGNITKVNPNSWWQSSPREILFLRRWIRVSPPLVRVWLLPVLVHLPSFLIVCNILFFRVQGRKYVAQDKQTKMPGQKTKTGVVPVHCQDKTFSTKPPWNHVCCMPRGSRIAVVSDPGRGKSSLIQNQICRSAPWAAVYVIHGGRIERIRLNRTYETYNGTSDAGVLGRRV